MAKETPIPSAGQSAGNAPTAPVMMLCRVLINGTVYNGAHHAGGKEMPIPEADATALASLTPPKVEILGVA